MKILTLTFLLFLVSFHQADAQVNSHAIGVRLGGSHYGHYGGEVSYQLGIGEKNRLEFDLGARNHKDWNHVGLSIIYHWVWNITSGLNWYVGPGARIGFYTEKDHNHSYTHSGAHNYLGIAVGGQIGIEYDFNEHSVPILLSLDARPMWNFLGWGGGFGYGTALGIRYTF